MKKLFTLFVLLFAAVAVVAQPAKPKEGFNGKWFLSAGAGTLVYVGEYDAKAPFSDRMAPNFEFSIGKWINPQCAIRLQLTGFNAKGAATIHDPFVDAGSSPFETGIYPESFNVSYAHVDVIFNFSAWVNGYKSDRFFELLPEVGVGWVRSSKSGSDYVSNNAGFQAGLIGKFRLSSLIDLNLELKGIIVNEDLDGVTGNRNGEGMATGTVGLAFKF
jgi:hypothetical protein